MSAASGMTRDQRIALAAEVACRYATRDEAVGAASGSKARLGPREVHGWFLVTFTVNVGTP